MTDEVAYLQHLAKRGGPDPNEYERVATSFAVLGRAIREGKCTHADIFKSAPDLARAFSPDTTQGLVLTQPYGYPGDFEIIDRIYQQWASPRPDLARWDYFAHSRRSNKAVRNRKAYFIDFVTTKVNCLENTGAVLHILNIGSGSCRDIFEFLDKNPDVNVSATCVDHDAKAIAYARQLCSEHIDNIQFVHCNAFRFTTPMTYRLIWSAGLFDYLDDRGFCLLLKRLCSMSDPEGEIVIGNFSTCNPDREYMAFGKWELHHRTESDLLNLVENTGIQARKVFVQSESEGINLFLHIQNPHSISSTERAV